MNKDERAEALVAAWVAEHPPGTAPPVEEWMREHPDLADELRAAAEAMRRLGRLAPAPEPPRHLGEYRILREIGRGGMGVVYEAEQPALSRRVALKLLYPSITGSAKAAERFRREARVAAQLKHTNIVTVHQLGEQDGVWFCAMELVDGHSLDKVIAELRRLGSGGGSGAADAWRATTGERRYFERVAEMFAEVAEALHLAHGRGVVHRDVKPANLMVSSGGQLRILDFGLARVREEASGLTMTGDVVGTPQYMSPEQALSGPVDARSDVWSLGATLYEVVTLKAPFEGKSVPELCSRIVTSDPALPRRANGLVPKDLETIVLKAMEKEAGRRYVDAGALARDLRRFSQGSAVEARRIGVAGRAWRVIRRNKARSSLAAAVLLLAGVGAVLGLHGAEEARRRHELEYARLCTKGWNAAITELTMSLETRGVDTTDAAEIFTEALRLVPGRPEAPLGRALSPCRPLEDRLHDLDVSRERGLSPRTWRLARGYFLRRAGRRTEADEELARAQEEPGGDPLGTYFEAFQLTTGSRWADARETLTALLSSKELDPIVRCLALSLRAEARGRAGEHSLALEDLIKLQALGNESPSLRARIALTWRGLDAKTAEETFDEALARVAAARSEWAWREFCFALNNAGAWNWLDRAAREATDRHPASAGLLVYHACALENLDRAEEALAMSDHAIQLDPQSAAARESRGRVLDELGRREEALAEFDRAIELDPQLATAHVNRGKILNDLRRCDEALAAFDRAIEVGPEWALTHSNRGVVLRRLGRHEEALAACDRAIEIEPGLAAAHVGRANVLVDLGRAEQALAESARAIDLDPGDPDAHGSRANALLKLGRGEEALQSLDRAIDLDPERAYAHHDRGVVLRELGRGDEALAEYDRAIELDPRDARYHGHRGQLALELGRFEEALKAYDHAVELDPTDSHARDNRGCALVGLGRLEDALAEFDRAIELDPKHVGTRVNRAHALLVLGRNQEALAECERAIQLDPSATNAHCSRGFALHRLGRLHDALAEYDRAIELEPRSVIALASRADVLWALGQHEEAVAAYRRLVDLDPAMVQTLNERAWNLATCPDPKGRDPARAVDLARAAVDAAPADGAIRNTLGVALYRAGETRESLKVLAESMRLQSGGDANDWFFAAMAHARLGEREEARALLDRAVAWTAEHAPDDPTLRRFREEAEGVLAAR